MNTKGLSLFSNVGIAETYMKEELVDIVVANELLKERASFYHDMYPSSNIIQGDITDEEIYSSVLSAAKKEHCSFLIATPPCQGMSLAGKLIENDPRNSLIKYVIKMIKDLQPDNIIIENVKGILNTFIEYHLEKVKITDYIIRELEPFGYHINYKVVDVADYGTPQHRKRAIFLISKIRKWDFPETKNQITVRDAIGHLPSLESGEKSSIPYHNAKTHNDRHILFMKNTPTGKTALNNEKYYPVKEDGTRIKGYSTTYKRISWDKPSPTITMANGSISSQNNVHPGNLLPDGTYSDARVLSLKEIFILTGLPDDWSPPSWASESLIRKVIGEGIPPLLIKNLLSNLPI